MITNDPLATHSDVMKTLLSIDKDVLLVRHLFGDKDTTIEPYMVDYFRALWDRYPNDMAVSVYAQSGGSFPRGMVISTLTFFERPVARYLTPHSIDNVNDFFQYWEAVIGCKL